MSKRRGDDRQIDRNDYEAQEDEECEDAGTFQKASADVLAARRIVRTKRTSNEAPAVAPTNKPAYTSTNPFSSVNLLNNIADSKIANTSNPFGGFTGLADKNTSFGGFTGQAEWNSSNIDTPKPQISISSKPSETIPPAIQVPLLPKSYTSIAQNNSHQNSASEFQAKIKKLNETFSSWLDQQIVEHPVSIWRDGVQDYIKYVTLLTDKYASSDDTADIGKKSVTSAPTSMTSLNGSNSTLTSSNNSNNSSSFGFTAQTSGIGATTATTNLASTFTFNPISIPTTATSTSSIPATTGVFGFPIASSTASKDATKDKPAVASLSFLPPSTSFTTTPLPPFTGFGLPSAFKPTSSTTTSTLPNYPTTSFNFTGFGGNSSTNSNFSTPQNPMTPNTGFGFGLGATTTTTTNDNDGEEEEIPLLPPEVVLKNDSDKDEVLHDVPCKLFRFDKEKNEWTESGKGTLRVTKDIETMKQRILIRNAIGKISLNTSFYKGMKFEKSGKNGIRFAAATGGSSGSGTELMTYLVKLKPTDIDSTFNVLVKGENSVN